MRFAQFVRSRFASRNGEIGPKHAPVSVVWIYDGDVEPVFNLHVEDQHEFFANGVLVHNCVWALTDLMDTPPPVRISDTFLARIGARI